MSGNIENPEPTIRGSQQIPIHDSESRRCGPRGLRHAALERYGSGDASGRDPQTSKVTNITYNFYHRINVGDLQEVHLSERRPELEAEGGERASQVDTLRFLPVPVSASQQVRAGRGFQEQVHVHGRVGTLEAAQFLRERCHSVCHLRSGLFELFERV